MEDTRKARLAQMEAITTKEMRSKIFDMAWPATVEAVLQMMIGMVTSAMIGQVSTVAIGAVGLGKRITQLVWALFAAIGTGSTVMVARSIGAGNQKAANRFAEQAITLTLSIILIFTLVLVLFPGRLISLLYGSTGELLENATLYLKITALGVPFMSITQVVGALMRGAGNTKVPMMVASTMNIINAVLGYLLIFGKFGLPALGLKGAAWAMVIAQVIGGFMALYILYFRQNSLSLRFSGLRFVWKDTKQILNIGVPAATENLFLQFGGIMLTSLVASFGTVSLAAHQQGMTAESLSYMPSTGFSIAATAFVSMSVGAGSIPLAQRYVKELVKLDLALTAFTASILLFFPKVVFTLLSNDPAVVNLGAKYLILMGICQIPQQMTGLLNGALRGAGDTKATMVISSVGYWLVRLPLSYLLSRYFNLGIMGVWYAMTIDIFVRFAMSFTRYQIMGTWKKKALQDTIN
ncbi:MAG: MATE family efflux transporter [Negativicutes bacterium]|nr:MATE family efflux transporter [Negativicutes bacterium]